MSPPCTDTTANLAVGSTGVDFGAAPRVRRPVAILIPPSARGSHAKGDGFGRAGDDDPISFPLFDQSLTFRRAGPRYPIAQVIVTVAEPRYSTGASGPVAPGSAPPIELPDPTATPGWGAASIIG